MAQQLYFCAFHGMWCIQTERAEEAPAGCLKTLASSHKARPTELQQSLNLMAANVHIVIHLEPAAPDVNKQYNFTALPPPPPCPPFYSPQPILGLYSLHTVILVPNLLADSLPLRSVWRHALFSPLRWALSGDHLIREGLDEKDEKRGLRWRTSLRWGLVSSCICKWHWLRQRKRFLLLRCGIPAGNLLREHCNVTMGYSTNSQRWTAVITIFCSDSQTEGQRKITQTCHWRTDVCFSRSACWLTW